MIDDLAIRCLHNETTAEVFIHTSRTRLYEYVRVLGTSRGGGGDDTTRFHVRCRDFTLRFYN